MSSLPRSGFSSIDSQKQLYGAYKVKNLNIKHRQYSSSKFIKTLMLNESKTQKLIEKEGFSEALDGALEKRQLKRYCINRFRNGVQPEKVVLKRKNSSLKLFRRDDSIKNNHSSKVQDLKNQEQISSRRDEKDHKSLSRDTFSSQQTISVKRRVQILNKNRGRGQGPKLRIKDENLLRQTNKIDVSFEEKLKGTHFDEEKILSNEQIRSQNVLGTGLKKCSSSKIKILVKNPFERHIKHYETHQSTNHASIEEIPEMKQSQIVGLDESTPSMSNQHDLQQLLAMMS